jgi:DNA-binding protein WhiA
LSFSASVKNELCRLEVNGRCCLLSELAAVVGISGTVCVAINEEVNFRIITENAAFARKVFSIIKKLFNVYPEVVTRKSKKLKKHTSYMLVITASKGSEQILRELGLFDTLEDLPSSSGVTFTKGYSELPLKKPCCKKAFLRGAFLAGGSVSDPEKTYHLEITSHTRSSAVEISKLINSFGLNSRVIRRKSSFIVYLKEGENIVDFLNIIGAHKALLELENVRILKGMRNSVNRIVNCETANLEKMVKASVRQVESIKYIEENLGFSKLPDNLREIAELRLKYDDVNLKELGQMLSPSLGKSGVNHRLKRLDDIAENLRKMKGDNNA